MTSRNHLRLAARVLDLALVLAIVWLLAGLVRYALGAAPGFDGAMNLNTARYFAEGRGYGFIYDVFFPFPAQTDGPFVLPSALLMLIGGLTPLTGQGVNLAYFIGTTILVFELLRRMVGSVTLALLGTLIVLQTPDLFQIGMSGYGEVPVLFWFVAAVIVLARALDADLPSRPRLIAGGFALALCYLTKAVALLLVAPTFGLYLLFFAVRHRAYASRLLWLGAGLALPIIGWELFRFIELGSLHNYAEWWRLQIAQVAQQSGAQETAAHVDPWAKGVAHWHILADLIEVPEALLAFLLFVPWSVAIAMAARGWRQRQFGTVFCLVTCGAVAVLYFAWWLFVTPTNMTWLRRILDGLLVQQILLAASLAILVRALWLGALPGRLVATGLAVALIVPEAYLAQRAAAFTDPPTISDLDRDQFALAQQVRNLPADATLFGFGWWQAPGPALFSGRTMMNYDRWDAARIEALPHKYLVLDYAAVEAANPQEIDDIVSAGTSHVLADSPGGRIYQLDKVLPYAPFTADDRGSADLGTGFDTAVAPYAFTRGFYSPKRDWVKPDSAVLFQRSDQVRLTLSIFVPSGLVPWNAGEALRLHVTSPGCLDASVPFDATGMQAVSLKLTCPPTVTPQPMEIWFHLNGHLPFVHQLDADTRPRGFAFASAHLRSDGSP
jgi:4-amino-4-deoxy-L-arabinose transferase-like glycosyltransferase